MSKIRVQAKLDNLDKVLGFVNKQLKSVRSDVKEGLQLELSIEEAYVNIVNYAYGSDGGDIEIRSKMDNNPLEITIQFIDSGIPYNPLKNEDPNISLNTEDKELGGLGILLIKNNVDQMEYEYNNGKNIFTIKKKLKQN